MWVHRRWVCVPVCWALFGCGLEPVFMCLVPCLGGGGCRGLRDAMCVLGPVTWAEGVSGVPAH